ncbi:GntR family transcriptional regulator [Falsiruegeria mediterranea]|uniref:HTH-type transcriptional repressor RspR n=1 Tax=Falsiruegeria mediterranea M17 TaxID=1200281 RepID=A0A2R8C3X2_9RHOB|nr:GntR family transcriptional regulator [Falsiruegeria mediterranea]SPJ27141.1 HTH-type transcriptional repressor RspR [Falsiruegeria mediterranea M17]
MSTSVDLVYEQVRQMAANFEFKPAERINESELSKQLGASRTPLREAMNRLTAEGLLMFEPGRGFFCQPLTPELVVHLYEVREALETSAIRAAVERAGDDDIAAIRQFLSDTAERYADGTPTKEIVRLDEEFHLMIAQLSGNPELVNMIKLTYERIRYVRWIAMRERIDITHSAHLHIFEALENRDAQAAEDRMRTHIKTHNAEATEIVGKAYSNLYVPQH